MGIDDRHDTIFDETDATPPSGAEVRFDFLEPTSRWLLKVVAGPNSGAEFALLPGNSYTIGTDPKSCEVVFSDSSVSRQHAKISLSKKNEVTIEDLGSKNGTFLDAQKLTAGRPLTDKNLVTMGTTTFLLIDREGEHHTIVSPLPGTKISAQFKEGLRPVSDATIPPIVSEVDRLKAEEQRQARHAHAMSSFIILAIITALFVVAGIGTTLLFRTEELKHEEATPEADTLIKQALQDFSSIKYSYNPSNGKLLLVGHLMTAVDRSKLLDNLQQLRFISDIDYKNVVIDEYVWREINQVLAKNPAWKGITISSPAPGKFIMTGFLKTTKQADELNDYISQNFPYLDLLERKILVEEDLKAKVAQKLINAGMTNVSIMITEGQLQLSGTVDSKQMDAYNKLLAEFRQIPGVRNVVSFVVASQEQTMINISNRYTVTGYSSHGQNITVVINGRLLSKGDVLDGMVITQIQPNAVILEKEGFKYRIDFNK